ncbi:MAG: ubiquinone biosynthesis protein UbiJ [Alteromonadaceae bacterium]|jgi:ubiquinone biosynthesis protein UbiJ
MSTFMHQQLLCSALEKLVNMALALNLQGKQGLDRLEQKTLSIHLQEIGFPLSFTVSAQNVLINTLIEHPDCSINTSVKTLLELKKEQQLTELIKQDKLELSGDIKVAQNFADIAETLDIDWQSELAKHIGDIPTYKLTQVGKFVGNKLKFAAQQIQADASEWLVHEKKLVVTRSQISHFNHQVSELEKQVQLLANKAESLLNKNTSPNDSAIKDNCE